MNWSSDDRSHRERLHALLADGQWHVGAELRSVGGDRFGSRLHELRRAGLLVAKNQVKPGVWRYRLVGELESPPARKPTWRERALAAEARLLELELANPRGGS